MRHSVGYNLKMFDKSIDELIEIRLAI